MNPRQLISKNEYDKIHHWIRYRFGSAKKCENKKCTGVSKRYHWALRKGKLYAKKKVNFIQLCSSCHIKMDITDEFRAMRSKMMAGKRLSDSAYESLKKRLTGVPRTAEVRQKIRDTLSKKYWTKCVICSTEVNSKVGRCRKCYKRKYDKDRYLLSQAKEEIKNKG